MVMYVVPDTSFDLFSIHQQLERKAVIQHRYEMLKIHGKA